MFQVHRFISHDSLDANMYIFHGLRGDECAVIDPSDAETAADFIRENNLHCTHLLLTHGHFDHIGGVAALKRTVAKDALVCVHSYDAQCLENDKYNLSAFMGMAIEPSHADKLLNDGDVLDVAGASVYVLFTPGHSPGSVCFVLNGQGVIFSGDTLFRLSVGRADLYGANPHELENSLINKLYKLDSCNDYRVLPGHERETTLDFERKHNPFTRDLKL